MVMYIVVSNDQYTAVLYRGLRWHMN